MGRHSSPRILTAFQHTHTPSTFQFLNRHSHRHHRCGFLLAFECTVGCATTTLANSSNNNNILHTKTGATGQAGSGSINMHRFGLVKSLTVHFDGEYFSRSLALVLHCDLHI
jgi:hypothetical protein